MTEFVHPALLYAGPTEYLTGTIPFIQAGLDAGEVPPAAPHPGAAAAPRAESALPHHARQPAAPVRYAPGHRGE